MNPALSEFGKRQAVYIGWYDGMLEGLVLCQNNGWHYLKILWWSTDFETRIFAAISLDPPKVDLFLQEASHFLAKGHNSYSVVQMNDDLQFLIDDFDIQHVNHRRPELLLIADPHLDTGIWLAANLVDVTMADISFESL